jgi:phosphoribosylamine--glycine ligase
MGDIYFEILMEKRILLIGNGGREHAIAAALMRSDKYDVSLYNYGSAVNPGIKPLAKEIEIGSVMDFDALREYVVKVMPDFVIVGPDDPIGKGAADLVKAEGIPCFAPSKACAQLESSKSYTRQLLTKHGIDASPAYGVYTNMATDQGAMQEFFDRLDGQIVVKADGLLGGKGVLVAGDHFEKFDEAFAFAGKSIEKFGRVVFEEKLVGPEFSLISIVDGETVVDFPAVQDHKRAYVGDTGPNTGGMGCIAGDLPFLTQEDLDAAHLITVQVMKAVQEDTGERYVGVMFGGFMKTKNGVKLIEYNCRFGDPEALCVLPLLESDCVDFFEAAIAGKLKTATVEFSDKNVVAVYLCPEGYPVDSIKNVPIEVADLSVMTENQVVFYASVAEEAGELILKGSRAIGCVGLGETFADAKYAVDSLIPLFEGPMFYREDIGTPELIAKRIEEVSTL